MPSHRIFRASRSGGKRIGQWWQEMTIARHLHGGLMRYLHGGLHGGYMHGGLHGGYMAVTSIAISSGSIPRWS